jgi:inorganic pyrophosphatase
MRVFIENGAGSKHKSINDRLTLALLRTVEVSAAYPYPYGFILGTIGGDGDAVDCFVLTPAPLEPGTIVECDAIGLLEQIEDGQIDHKVLAVPRGCDARADDAVIAQLRSFITRVFAHVQDKQIELGRLLDRSAAEEYVMNCRVSSRPKEID